MKRVLGIVAISLAALAVVVLWCLHRAELASVSYDSFEDARIGIEVGWLPKWLPRSATGIVEWHDIDTNDSFTTFSFDPTDVFYVDCAPKPIAATLFPRPQDASQFPYSVREELERVRAGGSLELFRCSGGKARGLAVDSSAGTAYVWTYGSQ